MERRLHALWWKSTQLHPRRCFFGVDLYHMKWKKMTLPGSIGRLLGAVPKATEPAEMGCRHLNFTRVPRSSAAELSWQLICLLCLIFLTFWLLGASSLAPAGPDGQRQDTMPAVPKLLRTQNLGSHPSCKEIAVKAFFSPVLASFSHAGSPTQRVLQDPAVVWVAVKPLGLFWGRCLQAGNSAGFWPNSSGGRGDTI